MKNGRVIPGTILVVLGALMLLSNFGLLHYHWYNIWRFWPVLLVMVGVNVAFAGSNTRTANGIKLAVLTICVGIIVYVGINGKGGKAPSWWDDTNDVSFYNGFDNDTTDVDSAGHHFSRIPAVNSFYEGLSPQLKEATLNVSGGADSYSLTDTTLSNLFEAISDLGTHYTLQTDTDETQKTLNFVTEGNSKKVLFGWGNHRPNRANMRLNTSVLWNINVDAGATKIDFDLSPYRLKSLKIDGGAASFKVKLGQPEAETHVDVSTGVAEVKISIPKNVACHITTDTGLSEKHFDGFNKINDSDYQTPGFNKATRKIFISLDGGVSSFRVSRY